MIAKNTYHHWNLFDLLDHRKQIEDKVDEMVSTVMRDGLATPDEKRLLKGLKDQLALINAEINDKTK